MHRWVVCVVQAAGAGKSGEADPADALVETVKVCPYRHPSAEAMTGGKICSWWIRGKCRDVDCNRLHPSNGLMARSDCLAFVHPRMHCNGRRFNKVCL